MDDHLRNCLLDIIATLESGNSVQPQSTQHEQIVEAVENIISVDEIKDNRITKDIIDDVEYDLDRASELFKSFL